jgi:hypothetical protein
MWQMEYSDESALPCGRATHTITTPSPLGLAFSAITQSRMYVFFVASGHGHAGGSTKLHFTSKFNVPDINVK